MLFNIILLIIIIYIFFLSFVPSHNVRLLRISSLYTAIIILLITLLIMSLFPIDNWIIKIQPILILDLIAFFMVDIMQNSYFVYDIPTNWDIIPEQCSFNTDISTLLKQKILFNYSTLNPKWWFFVFGTEFDFGLNFDGISLLFVFLTIFLFYICKICLWDEITNLKFYLLNLYLLELLLLLVFTTDDILLFYLFFESVLVPMFFLIGFWGSRERRIRATYLLFFYTFLTSLVMLTAILYIYTKVGSCNMNIIVQYPFSLKEQQWLWLAFFISFASKIPMFPFHIWLPEAHVEASTIGSVILAGVLLKIGVYGLLRFNLTFFVSASWYFSPFISILSVIGVIYASLTAIRQTDLKRIIAYASIAHMNLVVLGLFSFNIVAFEGAIIQCLSHGFISSALFLLVGILYTRYHSRLLLYYSGLTSTMPLFSFFFMFYTMANIALPGTSSFIGEFMILTGIYKTNPLCAILGALGVILSSIYGLWLSNRILFGNIKNNLAIKFTDLSIREQCYLTQILFFVLLFGLTPTFCTKFLQNSSCYSMFYL